MLVKQTRNRVSATTYGANAENIARNPVSGHSYQLTHDHPISWGDRLWDAIIVDPGIFLID
ncbi:MAG: hypothetical protein EBE86_009145 [Hormoscilla sp. GUM202]|nr:hypothetical protein [Hormoscilla sp. GUM202]